MKTGRILCSHRPAFALTPQVCWRKPGMTLADYARSFRPALPPEFMDHGTICINGEPVSRAFWHCIRPRKPRPGKPIELTFHVAPRGGGGGGGKKIFSLVASIALSMATGFVLSGGLATKFGLGAFTAGSTAAYVAAAGVQVMGSLLIGALVPPPRTQKDSRAKFRNEGTASVEGNVLDPNGPIPRVIGKRKIFPPLAVEPLTYFDGADEVVEAVFALAGPHRLSDIRIGSATIADVAGVEVETREGWPGDARLDLIRRQARSETVQAQLSAHITDGDDGTRLDTTLDPSLAVPQSTIVATRAAPHEHQLQLIFPQGLFTQEGDNIRLRVPVRLRMRPRNGGAWRNLPELHFQAANLRQLRATIRLIWTDRAATPSAASGEGWVEARRHCPAQGAAPANTPWEADQVFGDSGPDWMDAANLGSTGVQSVELDRYEARILLDPADWPPGMWEIEIIRGACFKASNWTASSYQLSGSVWDLFGYRNPAAPTIAMSRDQIGDNLMLLRSVSIWNEAPVVTGDVALIAVRARNRKLDRLSVLAGGWVPDWDGSGWQDWRVTDNPAPHIRDMLSGMLNADPLPAAALDEAGLQDFRAHCSQQGYRVNAVLEGQSVATAVELAAACGYARPMASEIWGVAMDRDTSLEAPVQLFTPRNSSDFAWRRAMPRLPDGLRVNFRDADLDYEARQLTVLRPGGSLGGVLEQIDYEGLVTESEIRARALYDLSQPVARGTEYSLTAPAEAIICRRGSLVAVSHDSIARQTGAARVAVVHLDATGMVEGLTLDAAVMLHARPGFDAIADLGAVEDMGLIGAGSAAMIRRTDGSMTTHPVTGDGETDHIAFIPPISPAGIAEDVLVAIGLKASETLRLKVTAIEPREDYSAGLTLIDEANEVFNG